MNKGRWHILLLLSITILVIGCSRTPSEVLSKKRMVELMLDVYKGDALIESSPQLYNTDSLKKMVKQSVFEAHGVSQETFDTSLVWYGQHTEEYVDMLKELEKRLNKEEQIIVAEARREGEATIASGDSVDMWDFGTIRFLSRNFSDSTMIFEFQPDADFKKGDAYQWQFRLLSDDVTLRAFMGANYEDGTSTFLESDLSARGWNKLRFQTDSTRTLSHIYGMITLKPNDTGIALIDSVQLVRTRVNPSNYYSNHNKLKKIPSNADLHKQHLRWRN